MRSFFILSFLVWAAGFSAGNEVDFNRDIRPILSNKCFQCHGPDEETRKADLRLDVREDALKDSIVVGKPYDSELIYRVETDDSDELMPPPKLKKPITKGEIALLKKWIEQGAEYDGHWSFQPVERSDTLPTVIDKVWPKNGLDHFVLSRLEEKKIKPSPPVEPDTLARRLSIDLVGLLPEPDRVEKFVSDFKRDSKAAIDDYADELLASRHYGERWGRHWLDQARYADSHGYTIDGERTMWPYRDWVIRAMNRDMPFDQFTIEQIAGDLLETPTKNQLVATAFHWNTLINQEGGTDDEQFRNEEVVDRVNTTGAVWLGLTLSCAQCHTHKFDPITQKDYFQMFAYFNQGTDVNNTGATIKVAEGEVMIDQVDPTLLSRHQEAKAKVAKLESEAGARQKVWENQQIAALGKEGRPKGANWKPAAMSSFVAEGGATFTKLDDGSILAGAGARKEIYKVALSPSREPVASIRLRLIPHQSLPKNGPGLAGNGNIVLTRVEFYQSGKRIPVARAQHSHAQPGFSAAATIDDNPDTGWAINIGRGTKKGVRMNAPHEVHYLFPAPVPPRTSIGIILRHEKNDNYNIGRFAFDHSATLPENINADRVGNLFRKDRKDWSKADREFLKTEFARFDPPLLEAKKELKTYTEALGLGKEVNLMVMRDHPKPVRKTYIHARGDFLRPDKETGPLVAGIPSAFSGLAEATEGLAPNRLHLAKWLIDPDNPLTPRVTVNRIWMRYFGRGIVETENDFGTQGSFPTHPQLLDWLATRFMENGWSMKKLHRLIVTSATYQQSSLARPDLVDIDPLNHLLARQNRVRFDSEIVRDAALSASGLLNPKIGGPSITPAQPDGVYSFTQNKKRWSVPNDDSRFRRAVYVKFIRSAPYPLFTTFDSPDFQSVCTSRSRSNTPLQSLALANDEALFELAQGLGERLMSSHGETRDPESMIKQGFRICYSREARLTELKILVDYFTSQELSFQADLTAAKEVAPGRYPTQFSLSEAAAWTSVARALMNTDEFITRE